MGYITPKGLMVSSYKSLSMLMGYCQTPQEGGGVYYSKMAHGELLQVC